ncbi:MAG: BatA and WFA domain-containing protein [Anaerolineales bacterium]|nr:BatA and WFA domain-containing protein [Anaerolineales bacterium]
MSFLAPLALILGLLAVPIIILYMLKLRRKQVQVSSTLLWHILLRDRQANTPWQRLKRNLLLFLQLAILAALVLALGRPSIPVPVIASGSVIVLLDASASMNATDVSPTRFAAAKDVALQLANGLGAGDKMTVIAVSRQPQTLVAHSSDLVELRAAIEAAASSQSEADWPAAIALAAGATGSAPQITTVIVSDGGIGTAAQRSGIAPQFQLPSLPGEVRYVPIGVSSNNLSISALALSPTSRGAELFARVTNHGESERAVILSLYRDGKLFDAQRLAIPAGEEATRVFTGLPNERAAYSAQLSPVAENGAAVDSLPLDDTAYAVYQPGVEGRTLLVSPGNFFLEQLLVALPDVKPFRATLETDTEGNPGEITLPTEAFDLYVFDGVLPAELPDNDLLLVNPPENDLFAVTGVTDAVSGVELSDHALNRFTTWGDVSILQTKLVELPPWGETILRSNQGPLIFVGEQGGRRVAVVAFDLHDSDLPLQISYPILFSNLIRYLNPGLAFDTGQTLHPGDVLTINPEPGIETLTVTTPSGQTSTFETGESGVNYAATGEPGIYSVTYDSDDVPPDAFAVNLFSAQESIIQPQESVQVGRTTLESAGQERLGQREFWPWLAAAALLILMIEWGVYHRRQLIPGAWQERLQALFSRTAGK